MVSTCKAHMIDADEAQHEGYQVLSRDHRLDFVMLQDLVIQPVAGHHALKGLCQHRRCRVEEFTDLVHSMIADRDLRFQGWVRI